ncbi:PIG-L family deacetylase [Micromonospora sp. M12]
MAVSPHLDDAVFSIGGTLAALVAAGWTVRVVTCFTASVPEPSPFALACQLDKGLAADVDYMALRRAEDRAACALLGVEPVHLPLAEAPHRGYPDPAALFAGVRADDRPPPSSHRY